MGTKVLSAAWLAISVVAIYWSVNTWLVSLGGQPILDIALIDERPIVASLIGLVVVPVLLLLAGLFGARYAYIKSGRIWSARIPALFEADFNPSKWDAKLFQFAVLVIALGLPFGGIARFWDAIHCDNCVFNRDNPHLRCPTGPPEACTAYLPLLTSSIWERVSSSGRYGLDQFRIGVDAGKDFGGENGGASFTPGVTPWILLALSGSALAANGLFLILVFRRRRSRT